MIARINGKLIHKATNYLIVDVNGVGYRIFVPLSTYYALPGLGKNLQLRTITIVREDVFHLFGFLTQEEQEMFEHLVSVSKIGPKLGINILSGMSAAELKDAIILADTEKIFTIPGIGKKTAERIVLELKEKVGKMVSEPAIVEHGLFSIKPELRDAISALVNLGYKQPAAESALKKVTRILKSPDNKEEVITVENLIKGALKILSGK